MANLGAICSMPLSTELLETNNVSAAGDSPGEISVSSPLPGEVVAGSGGTRAYGFVA